MTESLDRSDDRVRHAVAAMRTAVRETPVPLSPAARATEQAARHTADDRPRRTARWAAPVLLAGALGVGAFAIIETRKDDPTEQVAAANVADLRFLADTPDGWSVRTIDGPFGESDDSDWDQPMSVWQLADGTRLGVQADSTPFLPDDGAGEKIVIDGVTVVVSDGSASSSAGAGTLRLYGGSGLEPQRLAELWLQFDVVDGHIEPKAGFAATQLYQGDIAPVFAALGGLRDYVPAGVHVALYSKGGLSSPIAVTTLDRQGGLELLRVLSQDGTLAGADGEREYRTADFVAREIDGALVVVSRVQNAGAPDTAAALEPFVTTLRSVSLDEWAALGTGEPAGVSDRATIQLPDGEITMSIEVAGQSRTVCGPSACQDTFFSTNGGLFLDVNEPRQGIVGAVDAGAEVTAVIDGQPAAVYTANATTLEAKYVFIPVATTAASGSVTVTIGAQSKTYDMIDSTWKDNFRRLTEFTFAPLNSDGKQIVVAIRDGDGPEVDVAPGTTVCVVEADSSPAMGAPIGSTTDGIACGLLPAGATAQVVNGSVGAIAVSSESSPDGYRAWAATVTGVYTIRVEDAAGKDIGGVSGGETLTTAESVPPTTGG